MKVERSKGVSGKIAGQVFVLVHLDMEAWKKLFDMMNSEVDRYSVPDWLFIGRGPDGENPRWILSTPKPEWFEKELG